MKINERIIEGHFGFDRSSRLKVSVENSFELRIGIDHHDRSAYIALEAAEVQELLETLAEWLEQHGRGPIAAKRH
jgi:hypothetical protein